MDKKKNSLFLLRTWSELLKTLRRIGEQNTESVKITIYTEDQIRLEDLDSTFYFQVDNPKQTPDQKITVVITRAPKSKMNSSESSMTLEADKVVAFFEGWLLLIKEHENITFTEEEEILKQYNEEIYVDFEIIDNDADTKAYDTKTQFKFLEYLEAVEAKIAEDTTIQNKDELLEETVKLKKALPSLTKRKTIRGFSNLFARIRKSSLSLLKEIWGEGKKEAIKQLIKGAIDNADNLLDGLMS